MIETFTSSGEKIISKYVASNFVGGFQLFSIKMPGIKLPSQDNSCLKRVLGKIKDCIAKIKTWKIC